MEQFRPVPTVPFERGVIRLTKVKNENIEQRPRKETFMQGVLTLIFSQVLINY